jgi:hypothetical protein
MTTNHPPPALSPMRFEAKIDDRLVAIEVAGEAVTFTEIDADGSHRGWVCTVGRAGTSHPVLRYRWQLREWAIPRELSLIGAAHAAWCEATGRARRWRPPEGALLATVAFINTAGQPS